MVEHLDGHTDIVHIQLYSDWLPWLDLESHMKKFIHSFINTMLLLTVHGLQGDATKRFTVASLLEKGRRRNIW